MTCSRETLQNQKHIRPVAHRLTIAARHNLVKLHAILGEF
jgi:hypothetical protein